uniref:Ribonuclease 3 n=1 Tax=Thermogemmatispora argillosa TaxID=2045280 RepID=A0A455T7W9_9CHLR|nr:ribonuclease III [Thermogemmatispora argillosa]
MAAGYRALEEALGVEFRDPALLQLALTHRSYIYETPGAGRESNERLEFLGDSILAFVCADFLYRTFPQLNEGELSNLRAALVKTETLAQFARDLNLRSFLLLGKGEQQSGGSQRVLASAFEAVLGAIYLDQGLEAVRRVIIPRVEPLAHTIVEKRLFKDSKSLLQELAQAREGITPSYRLVSQEGPSHNREFTVEVLLGERVIGRGQGRNKQAAEQEAAHAALDSRGWL